MNPWAAFYFVRYVAFMIAGILLAMHTPVLSPFIWQSIVILALAYFILYLIRKSVSWFRFGQGVLGSLILLFFGYGITIQKQKDAVLETLPLEASYWLLEAESDGEKTPKTLKVQANILARAEKGEWVASRGKLMLYIKTQETEKPIFTGSRLLVNARLQTFPDPLNPDVFNYKEYMAGRGIRYQAFVDGERVRVITVESRNSLKAWAAVVRNKASAQFDKYLAGKQEADIVKAMVLGVRETLDEEIMQAYATAGVMHVLAVSGLHVGFIYAFLNYLFRKWRRKPYIKWVSFACVLLVLWGYAFVAGLSPSVVRAAFMFSMLDLALKMKRKNSIFNTLAVAAFTLLIINPYNIKAVGFQLSFLAVAGIVYMAPKISAWYKGDRKVIRKVWEITAVTLAAQIATFPLGLYYFGQFPTYFFITNLLVVPAAGFILLQGFALLFVSFISSTLAVGLGIVLNFFMSMINGFIIVTGALPFSKLQGTISEYQLILLFAGILFLLLLLRYKTFPWAIAAFLSCILFSGDLIYKQSLQKEQAKLLVYHIPGYSAIHIVEGEEEFLMADEDLPDDKFQFQIQPHRKVLGLISGEEDGKFEKDFKPAMAEKEKFSFLIWRGKSLLRLHSSLEPAAPHHRPLEVDYLLITHNAVQDLEELGRQFKPKMLLIDGSNKFYLQKRLKQQAEELNLLCHITAENGAFELVVDPEN